MKISNISKIKFYREGAKVAKEGKVFLG